MVKYASETLKEIKEQMRGGKGSVTLRQIFSKDEMHGRARLCAAITINPGCSIGLHEHKDEEEIFYIVSGTGVVDDNGEEKTVAAGDAILTGGGAVHAVENREAVPLEMFAIIILF